MIHWVGSFSLALALCSALLTAAVSLWPGLGSRAPRVRWAAGACVVGAAGAVAALEWALLTHDFSVRFVAENGSRSTPLYYTLTSLWSAHGGSLLLWCLVLASYLCALALRRDPGDRRNAWAIGVIAVVATFFLSLALWSGRVFDRVTPTPSDGPGPTPLLQDHPAMGIHPPLLYVGLVGLVVPFAYAVAAVVTGRTGRDWLATALPWTRFAWTTLTAGIVLGAWWSYEVLGWGGYWAWDPVENASLMPWLLATALLHSAQVRQRGGGRPAWALVEALGPFLLAALGVLLTRSGMAASVHSFADSGVGPVLLGFAVALVVGVAGLVVARGGELAPTRPPARLLSRAGAVAVGNTVLAAMLVAVLLGTLLPLVVESTTGDRVSVGQPYFNRMVVPLGLLLLALMAVGVVLRWSRDDAGRVVTRLGAPLLLAAATIALVRLGLSGGPLTSIAAGLAVLVVAATAQETASEVRRAAGPPGRFRAGARWVRRRRALVGARVAHAGFAVLVVGIAASSGFGSSAEQRLAIGESVSVGDTRAELVAVERRRGSGSMETAAVLEVTGDRSGRLEPGLRYYPAHDTTVAEPAVDSAALGDVYASVLAVGAEGETARVRLTVNPLVGWVWAGGALVVVGGLLTLTGSRAVRTDEATDREAAAGPGTGRSVRTW